MKLLPMTLEEIHQYVEDMEGKAKALIEDTYRICWFMRGGVTAVQAFDLDFDDRKIISRIIEKNLETTKETQLPFF